MIASLMIMSIFMYFFFYSTTNLRLQCIFFINQSSCCSSAETLNQGFGRLFVLYIISKYIQSTLFIIQTLVTNGREAYFHSGICSLQKYGTAERNALRWWTILCRCILENSTELQLRIFLCICAWNSLYILLMKVCFRLSSSFHFRPVMVMNFVLMITCQK